MFLTGKLFSCFLLPPGIFIVILIISAFKSLKVNRKISSVLFAVSLILYLLSIYPINNMLLKPLEFNKSYDKNNIDHDCMIVLGGGIEETIVNGSKIYSLSGNSLTRIYKAYILWKEKNIPIIVTGGAVLGTSRAEAEIMAEYLLNLGVTDNFIIKEPLSRNTKENAQYTKKLLLNYGYKNVLLITSASHMKRSLILFNKLKIKISTVSSDYLSSDKNFSLSYFIPTTESLHISYNAMHEYFGILYALTVKL